MALFGASYLVMPSDCDPGYDPAFVLTTAILVFCVCVVSGTLRRRGHLAGQGLRPRAFAPLKPRCGVVSAGVLFPLMFDTRVKGLAENGVTIACGAPPGSLHISLGRRSCDSCAAVQPH